MISLDSKVNLAFFVSVVSICWNVILYAKGRKSEKIRIYDKVYGAGEWLLMYEYNNLKNQEYMSDDIYLERAVREHAKSHDMAQFFGIGFTIPEHIKSQEEKSLFSKLVLEEFTKFDKLVSDAAWEIVMSHAQSPVFCLENDEFKTKFDFVFKFVGENLSYFSDQIKKSWHSAQNTTVGHVRQQYISLVALNENSCEPFEDEQVDDPYVEMLKQIRIEYRNMSRSYTDKWREFVWCLSRYWHKIKKITKN